MSKRLYYVDEGKLQGHTPTGYFITMRHLQRGKSGFEIKWENGRVEQRAQQGMVEEELGIPVHQKQTGGQVGYPSEAGLLAVWRYLVDKYNDYDPDVVPVQ